MKKLIFIQIGLLLFLLNPWQTKAIGVYGTSSEAGKIMQELAQLRSDIGSYNEECDNIEARIIIRLSMMPDEHILGFINDHNKNACLRKDLDNLEKELGRIAEIAPSTQVGCGKIEGLTREINGETKEVDISYVAEKIADLQARIDCLRKYGTDPNAKIDEKCQGRTYYNINYEDNKCADSENKKIFSELSNSYKELKEKIKFIKDTSNWGFSTDIDYNTINAKATARAESWLKKNLSIQYKGDNFSFGIGYLTDSDKKRLLFDNKRWAELIPDLPDFPEKGITSEIYGQIEAAYQEQQFAEAFSELILDKEIFENINLDIATSLEQPLICYQFSCDIAKSSGKISVNDTPPGCTYPIKKLPDKTLTDGLKEKTQSLKELLDAHNKK